jgi:hypothetical protein
VEGRVQGKLIWPWIAGTLLTALLVWSEWPLTSISYPKWIVTSQFLAVFACTCTTWWLLIARHPRMTLARGILAGALSGCFQAIAFTIVTMHDLLSLKVSGEGTFASLAIVFWEIPVSWTIGLVIGAILGALTALLQRLRPLNPA